MCPPPTYLFICLSTKHLRARVQCLRRRRRRRLCLGPVSCQYALLRSRLSARYARFVVVAALAAAYWH